MAFTVRSWPSDKREQWFASFKILLLATLSGLCWFPLASISSFLGKWLALLLFHYQRAPGQPIDNPYLLCAYLTLMVLSAVVYLGLIPPLMGIRFDSYKAFLRSIGLTGISMPGIVSVSIALIIGGILVVAMLPSFLAEPRVLYVQAGPYHWLIDRNWIWWVTNLEPPLVEETVFRGLIIVVLMKRFPLWFAVLWSAMLFGMLHLQIGFQAALSDAILGGIGWAMIKLKTRSIWPGAVIHYGMNSGFYPPAFVGMFVLLCALYSKQAIEWLVKLNAFFDRYEEGKHQKRQEEYTTATPPEP